MSEKKLSEDKGITVESDESLGIFVGACCIVLVSIVAGLFLIFKLGKFIWNVLYKEAVALLNGEGFIYSFTGDLLYFLDRYWAPVLFIGMLILIVSIVVKWYP